MAVNSTHAVSVNAWILSAIAQLKNSQSARLDAELLIAHVLDCNRTTLYAWPERTLSTTQLGRLSGYLARRHAGEPIAYLTQSREFWSVPLHITPAVLVPRADTELLVELTINTVKHHTASQLLELGTGSGAISVALANEVNSAIIATDVCAQALNVARGNVKQFAANRVHLVQCNWLESLASNSMDIIVSNPPYLARNDPHLQLQELCHEPQSALVSGYDGLDAIRQVITGAQRVARSGCHILLEHGFQQAKAVQMLMQCAGFTHVETHQDLTGNDRVTLGQI